MSFEFPNLPGTYVLFLTLQEPVELTIGKLGSFAFPSGEYIYLGSARGPGGLSARLRHHLRSALHPHWHIDYLRTRAVVSGGFHVVQAEVAAGTIVPQECAWSQALLALSGVSVPVQGFGASDCGCGCEAHLVYFVEAEDFAARLQVVADGKIVSWIA